jgi:hypothetical protein
MNNSPLSNDSLLESIGNIVKSSNADVYAEQIRELKELNKEMLHSLEEAQILIENNRNGIGISLYKAYPMVYKRLKNAIKKSKLLSL